MAKAIGYDEMVSMLRGAIRQINDNHQTLSKLDSFGGDGDHGTTMVRAMKGVEKALDESSSRELKGLLHDIGWGIMGVDGGATGPLFGTLFMSMSQSIPDDGALDTGGLAVAFESALAGVQKQTKAQVGDKTMIDALVPAVGALRAAAEGSADVVSALQQAAKAAHEEWSRWVSGLRPGDPVYVKSFEKEGCVVRAKLHRQSMVVAAGAMDIEVPLTDLAPPQGADGNP